MVLMNLLISDLMIEIVRFVIMGLCMVAGVFAGKKLHDMKSAKKSTKENPVD